MTDASDLPRQMSEQLVAAALVADEISNQIRSQLGPGPSLYAPKRIGTVLRLGHRPMYESGALPSSGTGRGHEFAFQYVAQPTLVLIRAPAQTIDRQHVGLCARQ